MFGSTTELHQNTVDIWISRFRNGLAIANVEDRQALLELLVVFNGQGSFRMDPGIVFEMLREHRLLKRP